MSKILMESISGRNMIEQHIKDAVSITPFSYHDLKQDDRGYHFDYNEKEFCYRNKDLTPRTVPFETYKELSISGLWKDSILCNEFIELLERSKYDIDYFVAIEKLFLTADYIDIFDRSNYMHKIDKADFVLSIVHPMQSYKLRSYMYPEQRAMHSDNFLNNLDLEDITPANVLLDPRNRDALLSQNNTVLYKKCLNFATPLRNSSEIDRHIPHVRHNEVQNRQIFQGYFFTNAILSAIELGDYGRNGSTSAITESTLTKTGSGALDIAWRAIADKLRYVIESNGYDYSLLDIGSIYIPEWQTTINDRLSALKDNRQIGSKIEKVITAVEFWDQYIVSTKIAEIESSFGLAIIEANKIRTDPMSLALARLEIAGNVFSAERLESAEKVNIQTAIASLKTISGRMDTRDAQNSTLFDIKPIYQILEKIDQGLPFEQVSNPLKMYISGGVSKLSYLLKGNVLGFEIDPEEFNRILLDGESRKEITKRLQTIVKLLHPESGEVLDMKERELYASYSNLYMKSLNFVRMIDRLSKDDKTKKILVEALFK